MTTLSSKQLAQIIQRETVAMDQCDLFLAHIDPCLTLNSAQEKQSWIKEIQTSCQYFLRKSTELTAAMLGYNQYALEQLIAFITQPSLFSFDLLKEKGKGILYGHDIVIARQSLFNKLPVTIRRHVIGKKLVYFDLIEAIGGALNQKLDGYLAIEDGFDIGMAHSVYKLTINQRSYVLKPKDTQNLNCFLEIARTVNLKSFSTYTLQTKQGQWECADYIESTTLSYYLLENEPSDQLIKQLAYHAALADVTGRGDRHFENYIVANDQLYAVDLAILFWEDNELWTQKYAQAGMAEIAVLASFRHNDQLFQEKLTLFEQSYFEMIVRCRKQQDQLISIIQTHFPESVLSDTRCQFLQSRLNSELYTQQQIKSYLTALSLFLKRLPYKQLLSEIGKQYPHYLIQEPLLKMYDLAHQNRWACFFLLDDYFRGHLLQKIDNIAATHQIIHTETINASVMNVIDRAIKSKLKQV